jgi:hypothetical protein
MSTPESQAAKRTIPRNVPTPRDGELQGFYQADVTTSSGSVPFTTLGAKVSLAKVCYLQPAGGDVYVVAGPSGKTLVTGATADSASNLPGYLIANGSVEEFWFTGGADGQADRLYTLGTATCKLNIWESTDVK